MVIKVAVIVVLVASVLEATGKEEAKICEVGKISSLEKIFEVGKISSLEIKKVHQLVPLTIVMLMMILDQ